MKRFRYIIVLAWVACIVSACTDLDTKLNNQWSVDDTWTNGEKAQGVLLSVYQDVLSPLMHGTATFWMRQQTMP